VEVNLEGVEVASSNNQLGLPVAELGIIVFLIDGNSSEEGSIG
jgi:hypothetical protein